MRIAIAAFGVGLGLLGEAVSFEGSITPESALIHFLVGLAYLLGGLFAWGRDPANRTWPVMTAAGIGWFIGNLAAADPPIVHAVGVILADADSILLVALVLIYPRGEFDDGLGRRFTWFTAIALTGANVVAFLTTSTVVPLVVGLAVTVGIAVLVPRRWYRAAPEARRALGPAMFATSATIFAIGLAIVVRLIPFDNTQRALLLAVRDVAVLAIPVGFVGGFLEQTAEALRRSRARIVEAGDIERRRLERDLHDGAQQRLVSVALALRSVRSKLRADADGEVVERLQVVADEVKASIADLRELARGIHPAVLTEAGLAGAFPALAERAQMPVRVEAVPAQRFDPIVEATAYFVASEALANVGKHAQATRAWLRADVHGGELRVVVGDDGAGGADPAGGTGLTGLTDRVLAVGGHLDVHSPVGRGTKLTASLPLVPVDVVPPGTADGLAQALAASTLDR